MTSREALIDALMFAKAPDVGLWVVRATMPREQAERVADALDAYLAERLGARDRVLGIVLPGWTCPACLAFNGAEKEWLSTCRACGGVPAP